MIGIVKNNKMEEKNQALPAQASQDLKEIEEMYRAGVHFGYSRSLSHPKMRPFFYSLRNGLEIFNLEEVFSLLKKAEGFLEDLGSKSALALLVSTKPEAKDLIEKIGKEANFPYVSERWLGGTLTNFDQIKKRIAEFNDLREKKERGDFSLLTKKEASRLDKKLIKMEGEIGGLSLLSSLPSVLLVVDSKEEKTAVVEAERMNIPVISIMNSDCNPTGIKYPIPGNDNSVDSVQYLLEKLTAAYKRGVKKV